MILNWVKTRLSVILCWSIANLGGFSLSLLFVEIGSKPDISIKQAIIGGLIIALAQAWAIRQYTFTVLWAIATFFGWCFITEMGIGAIGWFVPTSQTLSERIGEGAVNGSIAGLTLGIFQFFAFNQQRTNAWHWIPVSTLGWAIAVPLGSVFGMILYQICGLYLGEVFGLVITWIAFSLLTSIKLCSFKSLATLDDLTVFGQ